MTSGNECACHDDCPEKCTDDRKCTDPKCSCILLWDIEIDALAEATSQLSSEEIHSRMVASYRRQIESW